MAQAVREHAIILAFEARAALLPNRHQHAYNAIE